MATLADARRANAPTAATRARRSFLTRLLGFLVLSLTLSVLIEWGLMAFAYDHATSEPAAAMLESELSYLHRDFRESLIGADPALAIAGLAGTIYHTAFQWTGLEQALASLGDWLGVTPYVIAATLIVQVFLVRLGVLSFSLPVFGLFATVGLTSGLALRDIRRWSGGREYGGLYHAVKRLAPRALLIAWFVYLTLPVSVHPNAVILPCAVLFGAGVAVVAASYKKYL